MYIHDDFNLCDLRQILLTEVYWTEISQRYIYVSTLSSI